jgi:hypothetical protein
LLLVEIRGLIDHDEAVEIFIAKGFKSGRPVSQVISALLGSEITSVEKFRDLGFVLGIIALGFETLIRLPIGVAGGFREKKHSLFDVG